MRILNFIGDAHLGDSSLDVRAIKHLVLSIEDIEVTYYCKPEYYTELSILFIHDRFKVKVHNGEDGIKCWVGNESSKYMNRLIGSNYNFIYAVMERWNDICESLGYCRRFNSVEAFMFDFDSIANSKWKDKSFDIVVVNSAPCSGQINYDNRIFEDFVARHKSKYTMAVTTQINDKAIFCTRDNNMTLSDVGALAFNSKVVIGINTSPILYLAHKWSNIKDWIIFVGDKTNCTFNRSVTFFTDIGYLNSIVL